MGRLAQIIPLRSAVAPPRATPFEPPPPGVRSDRDLAPIAVVLFVASLARVAHAILKGEPFDTEPTFALAAVIGVPWLAWLARRNDNTPNRM